jgi:gliding motility-associated lipoprotein GldH
MQTSKIQYSFLFFLLGIVLVGCDKNRLYEENFEVDAEGWHVDDVKTFTFEGEDTVSAVNMLINFRISEDYPYSNLFIFLDSNYPGGHNSLYTLQFELAKPDGRWVGESSGTIVEFRFLVLHGNLQKGTYTFKIQHAMREEILPEVLDVGFRVELYFPKNG